MSLGQRLNKQSDKGSADSSGGETDVAIHRLKLLSKSQTSLLKAYVHGKLSETERLIALAIEVIGRSNMANDAKASDLKRLLQSLNAKEFEVDVESVRIPLAQELATLRTAVENGNKDIALNVAPPLQKSVSDGKDVEQIKNLELEVKALKQQLNEANQNAQTAQAAVANNRKALDKDAEKLQALEGEFKMVKDQLQSTKAQLDATNEANRKANGNATDAANAQVAGLNAQIESMNATIQRLQSESKEKDKNHDAAIKKLEAQVQEAQSRATADGAREQSLRLELEKNRTALSQSEAKLAATTKEWETKYASKSDESSRAVAEKSKELEEVRAALEAEKEEMMEALAQEVEEIETKSAAELEAVTKALEESQQKYAAVANAHKGLSTKLKTILAATQALSKEYKQNKATVKAQLTEMGQSINAQYKPALVGRLKAINEEMAVVTQRYRKEMLERKKLHNIIQELKGNIRVFMRCRPPTRKELEQFGDEAKCVTFPNPGEVKVFNEKNREKLWEFDEVFDTNTTQEQVYADVAALVTSVMDGFNVCIFAYGQTGSGKTWTMSGPPESRGVNTRALEDLFSRAAERRGEWNDTITVSLLEVYNEEIRDLLGDNKSDDKLEVKLGPFGNHVPGLTSLPVDNIGSVMALISTADKNRSSGTTNMNEHSSRSHMILTATIISEYIPTGVVTRGKLNLVDLAGSERINKSGATGQALKEAQNINKSLSALGDVIAARAAKQAHVPFRNSTLTYLLQDSISQDSKTLMIVCVSPVLYNSEETFCSLNFAARVRTVELGKATKTLAGSSGSNTPTTGNPNAPPLPPSASSSMKRK